MLLPYFGVVSIGQKQDNRSCDKQKNNWEIFLEGGDTDANPPSVAAQYTNGDIFDIPFPLDDILWDYQGPLMAHDHQQSALPADGQYHVDPEFGWSEIQLPFDWAVFS
ncbi:hypothetical protein PHISP_02793 [Aspergillus sp. HF37]|nr:hypothetical protein PHISP_02793 [Aspergillus sp. HF37]